MSNNKYAKSWEMDCINFHQYGQIQPEEEGCFCAHVRRAVYEEQIHASLELSSSHSPYFCYNFCVCPPAYSFTGGADNLFVCLVVFPRQ